MFGGKTVVLKQKYINKVKAEVDLFLAQSMYKLINPTEKPPKIWAYLFKHVLHP